MVPGRRRGVRRVRPGDGAGLPAMGDRVRVPRRRLGRAGAERRPHRVRPRADPAGLEPDGDAHAADRRAPPLARPGRRRRGGLPRPPRRDRPGQRADGPGEPSAHAVPRRRDGQRAGLRAGRLPQGQPGGRRGGAEVPRVRRRRRGGDDVRGQFAGRADRDARPAGAGRTAEHGAVRRPPLGRTGRRRGGGDGGGVRALRAGVQAGAGPLPLLEPGRLPGGARGGRRVPLRRPQDRRVRPAGAVSGWASTARSAAPAISSSPGSGWPARRRRRSR